jgi:hypothetical protein
VSVGRDFFGVFHTLPPESNHTPRFLIWKLNKTTHWYYPPRILCELNIRTLIGGKLKMSEKKKKEEKYKKEAKNKKEETADFYASLKKTGLAIEQQFNQQIQNLLNNEDLVQFANEHSDLINSKIRSLQKYSEVLSTILQFPTKNDVANVAKLTIQTEEKVDKLEELIIEQTKSIQKIMSKDFKEYKDQDHISNESKKWTWSRSIR